MNTDSLLTGVCYVMKVIIALLLGYMVAAVITSDGGKHYVTSGDFKSAPSITFLWVKTFGFGFCAGSVALPHRYVAMTVLLAALRSSYPTPPPNPVFGQGGRPPPPPPNLCFGQGRAHPTPNPCFGQGRAHQLPCSESALLLLPEIRA